MADRRIDAHGIDAWTSGVSLGISLAQPPATRLIAGGHGFEGIDQLLGGFVGNVGFRILGGHSSRPLVNFLELLHLLWTKCAMYNLGGHTAYPPHAGTLENPPRYPELPLVSN